MYTYLKNIISFLLSYRLKIVLNRKINKIYQNIKDKSVPLPNEIINNNLKLWKQIDKYHNTKWLKVYATINGIQDSRYISEQAYYNVVEPTLNNAIFAEAYSDKNVYNKFIDSGILPKIYLRCIHGVYYNEYYELINDPEQTLNEIKKNNTILVCKQSIETGGGKDVSIFSKNNSWRNKQNKRLSVSYLNQVFKGNFIIQEYISQHVFFEKFNSSSVNTVRIFLYRSVNDNRIRLLHAVFRIGKKGSIVDNQASGGISCGVNIDTGDLNTFAVDKYGNKYSESNSVSFTGKCIPNFGMMKDLAVKLAILFPYHRLLGFDFCVNKLNQVKLLEINNRNNEINFLQMNNGPLFKNYSNEIIDYCLQNKKCIKIDFEI